MNVFPGFGDGGRFFPFLDNGKCFSLFAELFGETPQQRDHALIAQRLDMAGLQIGLFQLLAQGLVQGFATECPEELFELFLGRGFAEDLAGFQVADDGGTHPDRHRRRAQPGETLASRGTVDLGLIHEAAIGFNAGIAGAFDEIERFAEGAAVGALIAQAPSVGIRRHEAQRQPGRNAERFLVHFITIRMRNAPKP